jgi:hypothetical protein
MKASELRSGKSTEAITIWSGWVKMIYVYKKSLNKFWINMNNPHRQSIVRHCMFDSYPNTIWDIMGIVWTTSPDHGRSHGFLPGLAAISANQQRKHWAMRTRFFQQSYGPLSATTWMVVWNIWIIFIHFSIQLGMSLTDFHSMIFQRGRLKPPTSNWFFLWDYTFYKWG